MSADVAYLDTSAVVKLLVQEPETAALRRRLAGWPRRASAALLRVELLRAVRRAGLPRLMEGARRQLASIHLIRLDEELLDRAAQLEPVTAGNRTPSDRPSVVCPGQPWRYGRRREYRRGWGRNVLRADDDSYRE
ncbi:MAG: type II toxin-antitoxin system VapC family toxin [Chloroflexi bacterium]|nr:MAG: type II toxin-antitoxin system VapC family toxin [Chloroflexota bacterium]